MSLPIIILQLCLPVLLDKYISKHGPLTVQSKVYPIRLAFGLVSFTLVYLASCLKTANNNNSSSIHGSYPFPMWYHAVVLVAFILHQVTTTVTTTWCYIWGVCCFRYLCMWCMWVLWGFLQESPILNTAELKWPFWILCAILELNGPIHSFS